MQINIFEVDDLNIRQTLHNAEQHRIGAVSTNNLQKKILHLVGGKAHLVPSRVPGLAVRLLIRILSRSISMNAC